MAGWIISSLHDWLRRSVISCLGSYLSTRQVRQREPWGFGVLQSFKSWEVSSEPSLSDHSHILFNYEGSVPARLIRN